jgi:hypothetical protein
MFALKGGGGEGCGGWFCFDMFVDLYNSIRGESNEKDRF